MNFREHEGDIVVLKTPQTSVVHRPDLCPYYVFFKHIASTLTDIACNLEESLMKACCMTHPACCAPLPLRDIIVCSSFQALKLKRCSSCSILFKTLLGSAHEQLPDAWTKLSKCHKAC